MRLICDGAGSGTWNMAVDEALLEQAALSVVSPGVSPRDAGATWRWYQWSSPTLSLGYFQTRTSRTAHPASAACPLVRRASGGGAILHDDELTYSLTLSPHAPHASQPSRLYLAVHESLCAALATLGVAARPLPCDACRPAEKAEPFLCFDRRAVGDVVIADAAAREWKIAGSAQRRHGRAICQHGSVLLGRSPYAPELPGIAELTGVRLSASALRVAWLPEIESLFADRLRHESLSHRELELTRAIEADKYASNAWTGRR